MSAKRKQTIKDRVGAKAAKDVLDTIADDLPDGAYLAMAEEFGLDIDDLCADELDEEE